MSFSFLSEAEFADFFPCRNAIMVTTPLEVIPRSFVSIIRQP